MVKVGNSECEFLKLTPLSRIAAMVGARSGVTMRARRPSGTNRITLCGGTAPAAVSCRPSTVKARTCSVFDLSDMAILPVIFVAMPR